MTAERYEVTRSIPADATTIFAVLCDPQGHVAIDASGSLMRASGKPAGAVGDTFDVHLNRATLDDLKLGYYDVTVLITAFEADREIAWTVTAPGIEPPIGHFYGYRLNPVDGGTAVTAYYDWSQVHPSWPGRELPGVGTVRIPVVTESTLRATLGILERTVTR